MFPKQDRQELVLEQLYGLKAKFLSLQGQVNASRPDPLVSQVLVNIGDVLNGHILGAKMLAVTTISIDIFIPQGIMPGIDPDYDEFMHDETPSVDVDDIPF